MQLLNRMQLLSTCNHFRHAITFDGWGLESKPDNPRKPREYSAARRHRKVTRCSCRDWPPDRHTHASKWGQWLSQRGAFGKLGQSGNNLGGLGGSPSLAAVPSRSSCHLSPWAVPPTTWPALHFLRPRHGNDMKLRLILKSSATRSKKSRAFELKLPVVIGRGEQATFRIPHVRVSRRHCELFEENGKVYIRDLGSTNGTMLRGTMLPSKAKAHVASGNVLTLGGLLFRIEYETPAAAGAAVAGAIDFLEAEPVDDLAVDDLAEPIVELEQDEDLELEAEEVPNAETAAVLPAAATADAEPADDLLEAAGAFLDDDDGLAELEALADDDADEAGSSDDDLEAFLNDS